MKRRKTMVAVRKDGGHAQALKQKLADSVVITPAFLPILNPEFCKCSHAIKSAANQSGTPLPLPTPLLPPL